MPETEGVEKNRKLRFSCLDDINLLKQMVIHNPYTDTTNWKVVHLNFIKEANKPFTVRAVKDHVEHLLMLYKKKDLWKSRHGKSATESQESEKIQLLQELCTLKETFKLNRKKTEEQKLQPISDLELKVKEVPFENPIVPSTFSTTVSLNIPENSKSSSSLSTGIAKNYRDASTDPISVILEEERKDMDFERRKLILEEKKVELEGRRIALEEARMKYFLESQKQQHQLMLVLIEKATSNR